MKKKLQITEFKFIISKEQCTLDFQLKKILLFIHKSPKKLWQVFLLLVADE